MSAVYIVTSEAEYKAAAEAAGPADVFWCADRASLEASRRSGRPAELLDQSDLRSQFDAINRWAYRTFVELSRRHEEEPDKYIFLENHFYDVRSDLIRLAKYFAMWDLKFAGRLPEAVFVCEGADFMFVRSLQAWFEERGRPDTVRLLPAPAPAPPAPASLIRRLLAGLVPVSNAMAAARLAVSGSRKTLVVSGSFRHLEPLFAPLRAAGHRLVYADTDLRPSAWMNCRRLGLIYCVMRMRRMPDCPFAPTEAMLGAGQLEVGTLRLPASANAIWIQNWQRPFMNDFFEFNRLRSWMRRLRPSGVLLDDDTSIRRAFWLAARLERIPSFVVSHGVPMNRVEADLDGITEYLGTSDTLVNSDFEKNVYRSWRFDPARLHVTGVPRYDRLAGLPASAAGKPGKTVLYCAGTTIPYDFSRLIPVMEVMCPETHTREITQRYLLDLAASAQQAGARLVVKPHYDDESIYRGWLQTVGDTETEVVPGASDIHALEAQADVVVTAESSVMFEAAALKKPVILLNYAPGPSQLGCEASGLVTEVKSREALDRCLEKAFGGRLPNVRPDLLRFYWAYSDGGNARRAAARISAGTAAR